MAEDTKFKAGHEKLPGSGGRRMLPAAVRDMLEAGCPKAAKVLLDGLDAMKPIVVSLGNNGGSEIDVSQPDHAVRMTAAKEICDRLYGKPSQAITGADGEPLRFDISVLGDTLRNLAK